MKKIVTVMGVGLLTGALLLLAGCTSQSTRGPAKIVDGFGNSNNGSGSSADSQYGQSESQGVPGANSFQGQSIYADNARVGSGSAEDDATGYNTGPIAGFTKVVHFGFDQYDLSAASKTALAPNITYLIQHPTMHVVIAGHTDPRGSQEYNFHLGQRRADAVLNYMLQQGVAANQLCTVSYGELQPAVDLNTFKGSWTEAYSQDRRAVLEYNQTCSGAGNAS